MNKPRKISLLIIHIFLLTQITPVNATNSNTETWKREVNTDIEELNSALMLLEQYIMTGQTAESSELSGSVNERLQTMLEEDYLYKQIIKIRMDEPSYKPYYVNDLEIELDQDYGEIAQRMSEGIEAAKQVVEDARNNIGKQKALTWYITFMTSLKFAYDLKGLFTSESVEMLLMTINQNTNSDNFWEYSDADYIQRRWDVYEVNVATQQAIIIEQEHVIAEVMNKLNQLSKIENNVFAIHGQIELIKNNIVRVNTHIDAACNVDLPGLADAEEFNDGEYREALDANLDNVLEEYITWLDYNSTKQAIMDVASEKYEQTLSNLVETNQDTIPYTRSYNEFVTYYNTFDESYYAARRNVIKTYNNKINAWQNALTDMLIEYNAINFNDYPPIDMNTITVDIPSIDILDDSQRQMTHYTSHPYTFTGHTVLKPNTDADYSWYQPLLSHPEVITRDAEKVFNLVNAARESEAIYEDSTGIATWVHTGFSTLFSDADDSLDAAKNLDDLYDYLEGFDDYALSKSYEAEEIIAMLSDVRAKQAEVESYLGSVNRAYIPEETVNQDSVSFYMGKIPNTFGYSITLSESETLCDYIEKDLTNFIYQTSDLSTVNDDARTSIRSMYEYETEKYDFIITVNNDANELVEQLEPYSDIIAMLNDFRDVYKGYINGIEGSDNIATQQYLQEQMTAITEYSGLQEFIDLQREVNEMTGYIKPIRDPYSVYGGFRGNFSVLESDRSIVMSLRELEYVPSGEVSLSEIEQGFPNVHDVLDQPYEDLMEAYEHTAYMTGLEQEMDWLVFELELYSDRDRVEYIQYTKARKIWVEQVLPKYGVTNGFMDDVANRMIYEEIKTEFITIVDAHIAKEEAKAEEAAETLRRVQEEGLSSYWVPEMYGTPDKSTLIPDEELDDPMLSVIYDLYTEETLIEYGLDMYVDDWNAYWEEEYAKRIAEQEQEEYQRLIQRSIEEGVDYLNPDKDGFYYYLNSTSDPEFWLQKSIEDGVDYFNRNPDGTYPPYTGDGELSDDQKWNYQGDSRDVEDQEFREIIGEQRYQELELGEIYNIYYYEGYEYSDYTIDSEKTGKILGIFEVTYYKQTTLDGETLEVTYVHEPWWAFLVF